MQGKEGGKGKDFPFIQIHQSPDVSLAYSMLNQPILVVGLGPRGHS